MITCFNGSTAFRSLVLAFGIFFLTLPGSPVSALVDKKIPLELDEIREEISILNLLRGLYLSKDQGQKLLVLAQKAQQLRESALAPFLKEKDQIFGSFSKLRDALYLAPGAEKEAQEQAKKVDHEIKEAIGRKHSP